MQDSVEAEVMTAAEARIGEGPLRAAEGKEPKALQSEVAHLMTACEKLRARKRFFANKVDEITNPRAAPTQPSHGPEASPERPSRDHGAGLGQPFSAELSHKPQTSASPPPSDRTHLVESWVVTPPLIPAVSRAATPSATAGNPNHEAGNPTAAAADEAVAMSETNPTASGRAAADTDACAPPGSDISMREAGSCLQVMHDSQQAPQHVGKTSPKQDTPDKHGGSLPQQHSSRPKSSQSKAGMHGPHASQQCTGQAVSLRWADGVRAPVGVALAIGPWAHTSSSALPVTTQALQHDVIDLASSSGNPHTSGLGAHDRHTVDTEAGLTPSADANDCPAPALSQHTVGSAAADSAAGPAADDAVHDDQVTLSTQAAVVPDAAIEAMRESCTRETTPDGDSPSSQMCNVCLCPIRQLIIVLQPCGHYYCENCTAAIRGVANPRCPECRTRISSTFRVPLSSAQTQSHKEDAQHAQVAPLVIGCKHSSLSLRHHVTRSACFSVCLCVCTSIQSPVCLAVCVTITPIAFDSGQLPVCASCRVWSACGCFDSSPIKHVKQCNTDRCWK